MTPVDQPGVIDLAACLAEAPRRRAQSEWLEAWCVLRSEFLIGCDSGPSWLAVLLGVPVLTVNALHFRDVARANDRFICKLVRDRATGRRLTVSEMLTEDYLRSGLDTSRYEHIDNEPIDISEAVMDMGEVVRGREEMSEAQRRFNERLAAVDRQSSGKWSGLEGIAVTSHGRGTISRRFAEKYL